MFLLADEFWRTSIHVEVPKAEHSRVLACVRASGFTHNGTVLLGLKTDTTFWPLDMRHLDARREEVSFTLCGPHLMTPSQVAALTGGCVLSRAGLCIGKDVTTMLVMVGARGQNASTSLTWL